jgi:hypothetical protein
MIRVAVMVLAVLANGILPGLVSAQAKRYPLTSVSGLRLNNVMAQPATHRARQGVRITGAPAVANQPEAETLAIIEGTDFSSGVIEAEIAGTPAPGAGGGARGFVGIAFRLQPDMKTYDAFYLRPTNGRADDQERRNHATQYISHPDWTWFRMRRETPSKYESYVDLEPDVWAKIRIEVRGAQARLYVHDQPQPVLIVNDVKSGPNAKGAVALWIGPGTVAHFRNLTVTDGSGR